MAGLQLVAVSLALLSVAGGNGGVGRHPADGPDVDVRVRIASDKVVFTILANLAFVDEVVDSVREDEMALHPVEHEAHRLDLFEHFRDTNRVAIDGIVVTPVCTDFEVGEPDLSLLPMFPRMGQKALVKLRLVLEYPVKAPPRKVAIAWGVFPPDRVLESEAGTPPIQVMVQLTARGLQSMIPLTQDEPEHTWHDTGESLVDRFALVPEGRIPEQTTVPVLSISLAVLAGLIAVVTLRRGRWRKPAPWLLVPALVVAALLTSDVARMALPFSDAARLPTQTEALAVFEPLHANIYRAFDYVDESDIYDALERSVHGELLDGLYNQIYRSLIMQEQGGAVSQVQAVRPLATDVESIGVLPGVESAGFTVLARWQVDGAVFHWGHSHHRTNEYSARYTVGLTDSGWRIRDHEILEQTVVSTSTTDPTGGGGAQGR